MMTWRHMKLATAAAILVMVVVSIVTPWMMIQSSRQQTLDGAAAALERAGLAVENAFNRQILQVDGALAILPTLFAAAKAVPDDSGTASELLRSLEFQTLAYRNLMIIRPDWTILAEARPHGASSSLPLDFGAPRGEPTDVLGPTRNRLTGDWSLFITRTVPEWPDMVAVAEVPLDNLMSLLAETGMPPGTELRLQRSSGQLVAALPHDELNIGKTGGSVAVGAVDGKAAITAGNSGDEVLIVARRSLYSDIEVVMTQNLGEVLAGWSADRDRLVSASLVRIALILAFGAALIYGLHQQERADAERIRAAAALATAIEAMPGGFCIWDAEGRFVTCNQHYRDLYPLAVPFMIAGTPYETILREGLAAGQFPEGEGDPEAFVREALDIHRQASGFTERALSDGRWLLLQDRRMADGGTVGIRTDVTAMKTALVELAEANARALAASEEARRQNEALREREGEIRFLAHHDDLTRLPNRALLRERIGTAVAAAAQSLQPVALLYLDLDRFKEVNDTLGHHVGDALLCAVADRLRAAASAAGTVARLGGDEFAVLIGAVSDVGAVEALAAGIIEALGRPYAILGHTISTSASIGLAVDDAMNTDATMLLQRADLALYEAKSRGGAMTCVFSPAMEARLRERLDMEADLRAALVEGQLHLVYQPVVDLASHRVVGYEALLRWMHPQRGQVEPSVFVKIAEDTGIIVEIGAFVLREACRAIAELGSGLRIAVNLSPVQLTHGDFPATVDAVLRETGLDPSRLELEITETALFVDTERSFEAIRGLKSLGVRLVLDDFGTGFSSLSHLRDFSLDKVKIDRSFIGEMLRRPDSAMIVEAVATLASKLGMTTTAEGVETVEQLEMARSAGCIEAQGYLLGRPAPLPRREVVPSAVA